MRLVILGGGGFRVPLVVRAIGRRPDLGIHEITLYDTDPDRLSVMGALLAGLSGPRITTTGDIDIALSGADAVFSAIRVGGAAGRVQDERRAIEMGLLGQETVGAGGLAYGLRTLPVALEFARRQAELAPDAWLVNFTNPAGLVTQALSPILGDRVIGICDSPIALIRRARGAVQKSRGDGREAPAVADYVGINHLGWLRKLTVSGRDVLPALLSDPDALSTFEEGRLFGPDLLSALGALPNEYLHFYYQHAAAVAAQSDGATRGQVVETEQRHFYAAATRSPADAAARWEQTRRHREETYFAEARAAEEERDEADLSGAGYEDVAVNLLAALTGRPSDELILNVPNGGAVPNLPDQLVVETRCTVDASGATPLATAELSLPQLGLVASVRAAEEDIIAAVTEHSRDLAVRAFATHPLIRSWDLAERLVASVVADHPGLAELLH